jgi:exopolysaccharide biosynthesis polyprenyl glycosylphosphotransferase
VITERPRAISALFFLSDALAAMAAFLAAGALWPLSAPGATAAATAARAAAFLIVWMGVFAAAGLYRESASSRIPPARLARAIGAALVVVGFLVFALGIPGISRPAVLLFAALDALALVAGRWIVGRAALDAEGLRHVIVAGDRQEVIRAAARIDASPEWGLRVIGLASDGRWTSAPASPHPVLGALRDLPELVRAHYVDEVIVAAAPARLETLRDLDPVLDGIEEQGIVLRVLVNFLPQSPADIALERVAGLPLLTFSTTPRNELLLTLRRLADAAAALVLLIVLSPLLLLVALAVKLGSPGPVLFRQTRCGLNGRPFTFYKFRSMRADADALKPALAPFNEMTGPAFKMSNDPRVTRVGRLLRRTSLDELPQLWNILRGDMSFVGPRPAVAEEVARYEPWQRRRLSMRPGLTCLWQVSGRNELSFEDWVRLDLEYIDNWSLWLDVKIALKTIPAVIRGRGAR